MKKHHPERNLIFETTKEMNRWMKKKKNEVWTNKKRKKNAEKQENINCVTLMKIKQTPVEKKKKTEKTRTHSWYWKNTPLSSQKKNTNQWHDWKKDLVKKNLKEKIETKKP